MVNKKEVAIYAKVNPAFKAGIAFQKQNSYTPAQAAKLCEKAYVEGMKAQREIKELPTPRVRFRQWKKENIVKV